MIYDIHATSLYKSYGGFTALSNINLKIKQGAIFGLIGTSGAGKSTLLKILTGLEKHDEGVLEIFGQKIPFDDKENLKVFRQKISIVFQNYQLLNSLTVFENIALPLELQNKDKKLISEKVDKLLQLVGLHQKKEAYPASLSGGQKQRIAIARALYKDSSVLILDEATSALDNETEHTIMEDLYNTTNNITTIIISHRLSSIQRCDKIFDVSRNEFIK